MSQATVRLDRVWKKFRRGQFHDSLRDLIPALTKKLLGRGPRKDELQQGDFWALRDVSFEVKAGEALGIIGRNGAGKSTILKVLTRILRPTKGRVQLTGRVGSLIEVSAGFHPDLTGRENVMLQGSIMGMRPPEIARKFDEIVEFSGIAEFIDTPVKRYSSGMNARLGFSIAAHLDPEVLIIDEVLAVGDFAFQQRAFGRIAEMVKRDIPVVIVSHQLERVASLCTRAILMEHGQAIFDGSVTDSITMYVQRASQQDTESLATATDCPVRLGPLRVAEGTTHESGAAAHFEIRVVTIAAVRPEIEPFQIGVRDMLSGTLVFVTSSSGLGVDLRQQGDRLLAGSLQLNLPPGTYLLETQVTDTYNHRAIAVGPEAVFNVVPGRFFGGRVQLNAELSITSASETAGPGAIS